MGNVLHAHLDEEQAESLMDECGYDEIDRNTKGDTVNIVVVAY
jgi:hypothetical protein